MTIELCADVIARYKGKLVLVERKNYPAGLAFPGGRLEQGESLEQCAVREFKEETGLELTLRYQFKTYSNPGRDPRGHKVSTVFVGEAKGNCADEPGKTRVVLLDLAQIEEQKESFAFDHYQILKDYLKSIRGGYHE